MVRNQPRGLTHHPGIEIDYSKSAIINRDQASAVKIEADMQSILDRSRAMKESFVHRGPDETVDVVDYILNPNFGIVTLVSFTIPDSMVGYFDAIGVFYSEPICTTSLAIGWRVSIDNFQVPNINHLTENWRFSNFGDMSDPMKVKPIWVQSGETISVEVQPFMGGIGFNAHLTMMGRLTGRLYKPATPELIPGSEL